VDSVAFDVKIDSSEVAMKDVLYFAPQLDGMCGKQKISTEIVNKVTDLYMRNASIEFGEKSIIRVNFKLDEYRQFDRGYFSERISYAYIDVNDLYAFCLPYSTGQNRIQGSKYLDRIKYLETEDLQVKGGLNSFTVIANSMKSG